jgi:hypothetical protein
MKLPTYFITQFTNPLTDFWGTLYVGNNNGRM